MTTDHNSKQPNYTIHDDMYVQAKNAGWAGWGGNERLANSEQVIIDGNGLHCIIGDDRRTFLKKVHDYLADPREGSLADPHEGALQEASVFFVSSLCSKGDSYQLFKDGIVYRHISSAEDLVAELELSGFSILDIQRYERETNDHITIHAVKSG
ncbi:hypothetical protein [Marinomonas spartinae]|uniref:hypothetical protein n=1 Tax=Marinomonas spartinae TaxID=1792290 RepID=UPI0018F18C53|nr:hypothetical protein [Marinomonas spartinae]MBJ7555167.1 hypothetical protein [Marinomonas spartinae]